MVEFTHKDLQGSRFVDVHLGGSRFDNAHLGDTRFQNVWFGGARMHGVGLVDVEIHGEVDNLRINGIDVAPFVEAELNRIHPGRAKMRPTDADGFREAWDVLEALWAETVDRARAMDPALLHERVDEQWSFIETLRHLVFATDAWLYRAYLGEPAPWDPLDLPHDDMEDAPGVPRDRTVQPSLEEVLALRADRMGIVGRVFADLSWPGRPSRSPNRATRSQRRSRCSVACARWSTRSGSTGCTPSAIWRSSAPGSPSRERECRSDNVHYVNL
jgi:hypothetical protein